MSRSYLWEGCTEIETETVSLKLLRSPGIDSRAKNIEQKLSLGRDYRDRNRDGIFKLLRSSAIDSMASISTIYVARAGVFKHSVGTRNPVGIGLSYQPAKLHSLAELVPWNRFLGFFKV
jgi:hypothetical protein